MQREDIGPEIFRRMKREDRIMLFANKNISIDNIILKFFEAINSGEEIYSNNPHFHLHKAGLDEYFFDYIVFGTKTIEGRLDKNDWKKINMGTIIEFTAVDIKGENIIDKKIYCIVTNIFFYNTISEMLNQEGLRRTLPGVSSIEEGIELYSKWYPLMDQLRFGVLALELKVIA